MTLSQRQQMFTAMIGQLISYAYQSGYKLTFGDAYRDPRVFGAYGEKKGYSHPKSTHKIRLAVDFNVFRNGKFLEGDEANKAHNELHDYWDILGGAKRIDNDLNHYSLEYKGVI